MTSEIIGAIGGVFGVFATMFSAWLAYNQYTKNKRTDYEIEKIRKRDEEQAKRRSDNAMLVFGALWDLMHDIKADRVYIVQPHPLGNEEMLTIYFEVKHRGTEPMRPHIQEMKISEVAKFSSDLVKNVFMYITNIPTQVSDRYVQSIFSCCGTKCAIVKRLSDNRHDWVGSIFCEYTDDIPISEEEAKEILHRTATDIQYILPAIR